MSRGKRKGKTAKAPEGYYTASEAIALLGMPKTTFYLRVRTGCIKKYTPRGRHEGYYEKIHIDKMVEQALYGV